jgi:hypothetical protein
MNRFLGRRASLGLTDAMVFGSEGWTETKTSEGIVVLGIFSRSAVSNWAVAIGIRATSLTQALRTKVTWGALAITARWSRKFCSHPCGHFLAVPANIGEVRGFCEHDAKLFHIPISTTKINILWAQKSF